MSNQGRCEVGKEERQGQNHGWKKDGDLVHLDLGEGPDVLRVRGL